MKKIPYPNERKIFKIGSQIINPEQIKKAKWTDIKKRTLQIQITSGQTITASGLLAVEIWDYITTKLSFKIDEEMLPV